MSDFFSSNLFEILPLFAHQLSVVLLVGFHQQPPPPLCCLEVKRVAQRLPCVASALYEHPVPLWGLIIN